MKDYSQFGEQDIILQYFKKIKLSNGSLLSVGENDGETLSNARALLLQGWRGVLFEPVPKVFEKLKDLYKGNNNVISINMALGTENGTIDFYESDSHLGNGDHALLSTSKISELKKWKDNEFTKIQVKSIDWAGFSALTPDYPKFDFISIDAEGLDYEILTQIPLDQTQTKMVMIEYNGDQSEKQKINEYLFRYKFRKHYHNHVNLIYVK